MITFNHITLRRGQHVLLSDINWTIFQKQKIGIIGANGTGKSTLFATLLGLHEPDAGQLEIPKHLHIAHVAQEFQATKETALQFVMDGDTELRELQAALTHAEAKHDGRKIATLHDKLSMIDAYTAPTRAAKILNGLGFTQSEIEKPANEFSGGWQMRLNLARALMCRSDILLLDEPTNHLDLDAILWLENWLKGYAGTLLLISHDRDFLDHTVDRIAHLHHKTLKMYAGNYSDFESQLAQALQVQEATYKKQQQKIAHLKAFVDRFRYKATKARQAQSRLKAIERMETVSAVQADSSFSFEFLTPAQCPTPLLTFEKVNVGYHDRIIVNRVDMSLTPKDRIAILGPNGAGKSTFIKTLAGVLSPLSGQIERAPGLKIGYFAQHRLDQLDLEASALNHLSRLSPSTAELTLRTFLGSFGFSGNKIFEPVRTFSGGEKARLVLSLLVWQKPNLLLLDEPTNHLDLDMRNALSLALQDYAGAMVLITHDRFLVRTTVDQLLLVSDGKLQTFDGDVDDYYQWLLNYRQDKKLNVSSDNESISSRKAARQKEAKARESRRPILLKIKELEKKIETTLKTLSLIEKKLTNTAIYEAKNKAELQLLLFDQANIKKTLAQLEEEWLSASEERDKDI